MDVYLMQHGDAVAAESDPDRPLSDAGRSSVSAVASHAAGAGVHIDRIVHSGKRRAEQSAELLGAALGCAEVQERAGLGPKDSVAAAAQQLIEADRPGALAIVGHLPFLDRLASLLVTGDAAAQAISFRNAALVRLVPKAAGPDPRRESGPAARFAVLWILPAELATPA